jgi:hypothetical protein
MDTVRNGASRNALFRICLADGASALTAAIALEPIGGRPTKIRMMGIISATMTIAAAIMASANPRLPIAADSRGTPTMPPKLAPFSARLIAMPRLLSNQRPSVLVIIPRLVPAQPKASIASAAYSCHGSVT